MRDKFLDASDEKVPDEDGCLSRSMTITAHNKTVIVETCSITGYVTLHVRFKPETKDPINKACL